MQSVTQTLAKHQISAGPVDMRALLFEHKISLPTFLSAAEVQSLAKPVGADTLFVIRLTRCGYPERTSGWAHPKDWLGIEDKKVIEFSATMRASISGTLQALDLKRGRITRALPLEASPAVTLKSREAYPEGPSADEVQRQAVEMIARQVERVFLPWTEERELVFFDDKDCGLKQAAGLMKAGDVEGSARAVAAERRGLPDEPQGQGQAPPPRPAQPGHGALRLGRRRRGRAALRGSAPPGRRRGAEGGTRGRQRADQAAGRRPSGRTEDRRGHGHRTLAGLRRASSKGKEPVMSGHRLRSQPCWWSCWGSSRAAARGTARSKGRSASWTRSRRRCSRR